MQIAQTNGWSLVKVKRGIIISFLLIAIIFIGMYLYKANPYNVISSNLPFSLSNEPPQFLFAIYGSGMSGGFQKPMEVTVVNNKIYVTDTGNKRIQVFDTSGNAIKQFGKAGSNKGEFSFPYGIAGDSQGLIYVSDMNNGNISVFDGDGKFIKTLADKKVLKRPGGIYMAGDKLYVTDIAAGDVKVFDLNGRKLLQIGKRGRGKDQLLSPNSVTVDGNQVYVADSGNDRVQVFNTNGTFVRTLGLDKTGKTKILVNPRGLGVAGGKLFVVSKITNFVMALDKNGEKIFALGGMGQDDDKFAFPNGLFIDGDGRIYIADSVNQRVVVYQY